MIFDFLFRILLLVTLCSRIRRDSTIPTEDIDILKIIVDWLKSMNVLVVNPQHYCLDVISAEYSAQRPPLLLS